MCVCKSLIRFYGSIFILSNPIVCLECGYYCTQTCQRVYLSTNLSMQDFVIRQIYCHCTEIFPSKLANILIYIITSYVFQKNSCWIFFKSINCLKILFEFCFRQEIIICINRIRNVPTRNVLLLNRITDPCFTVMASCSLKLKHV